MDEFLGENREVNPLALGAAYLEYCVRQGWLTKTAQGATAQYELTDLGEKKLAQVPFNFDLSKLTKRGESAKKKRRHRG
jgi:hypothetical protein